MFHSPTSYEAKTILFKAFISLTQKRGGGGGSKQLKKLASSSTVFRTLQTMEPVKLRNLQSHS